MTAVVQQDLRGLAWLVRLTGNAAHRTFFAGGDSLVKLSQILGHPDDGKANDNGQVIIYNTVWPIPSQP